MQQPALPPVVLAWCARPHARGMQRALASHMSARAPPPCRYPVRVALLDLDAPPRWFQREQARDHLTAAEARAFAGTDGEGRMRRGLRFVELPGPAFTLSALPPSSSSTLCPRLIRPMPPGKVLLLTNPVSAGYTQNPISVYYCYAAGSGGTAASAAAAAATAAGGGTPRRLASPGAGSPARGTPNGGTSPMGTPNSERRRTRLQARLEQRLVAQPEAAGGGGGGGDGDGVLAACAGAPVCAIAEVTNTPWGDRVRFAFRPEGDQAPKALHVSPFMDMDNTW